MRIPLFSCLFFIPICSLFLSFSIFVVSAQCLADQQSLLLQLKDNLTFHPASSNNLVHWNRSGDCCSWNEVICSEGRVIGLNLSHKLISDGLGNSSSLFSLQYLQNLSLAYNKFNSSQIPSGFGKLTNLSYLNLSNAGFEGQIPMEISRLTRLVTLDLSTNYYSSRENSPILENPNVAMLSELVEPHLDSYINYSYLSTFALKLENPNLAMRVPNLSEPVEPHLDSSINYSFLSTSALKLENPNLATLVWNLSKLVELHLDGVNISAQGNEWCQALSSSLPNLEVLSLSNSYLSGPFNSSLLKLQSLSIIRLEHNNFSAPFPDFFANFANLRSLHLSSSGLNGTFPEKIFQVPTLETLDLSYNLLLHGRLSRFPQNGSLRTLVLSWTNFSGSLPGSIGDLKMLSVLDLSSCNFSGSIPSSMAKLTQLVYLDMSFNNFNRSIPSFSMAKNLTQIYLSQNNLTGQITSTQWEELQHLVILDLSYNLLEGSIPVSLFSHPSLQKLQLSNNRFSGQLKFNASSSLLDTLDLSSNSLKGPIPLSVFDLQGLKQLSLSSNNFNGSFQLHKIQHLRNLSSLDLSYNSLSIEYQGTNSSLSSYPQITTLKLTSGKLKTFPDFLRNQSRLNYLDLSHNKIQGEIPNWIWKLQNLRYLNLSYNFLATLEGPMLNLTSKMSVLDLRSNNLQGQLPVLPKFATVLDFSWNNFNSSIPATICDNLTFTYFFSLSNNNFRGSIPESICNALYLEVLDLSNNSLSGEIPQCLYEMNLGVLNLGRNRLSGTISDAFPINCGLQTLDLSRNILRGVVPKSLANCSSLEVLNLGNNKIKDEFPRRLMNVSRLRVLRLRDNNFFGSINCFGRNATWPMLQIVDLASNNFSGKLPIKCIKTWGAMIADEDKILSKLNYLQYGFLRLSGLYYHDAITVTMKGLDMVFLRILTIFTSIDVSCNNFEGPIPEEMGGLKALRILNLSQNALTGQIPRSLGNLTMLESLDLSSNNLLGNIPMQLLDLTFLAVLNLSFNQLVGKIPAGMQFSTFENSSFEGNTGLCGSPLSKKCINPSMPPLPRTAKNQGTASTTLIGFDWQFIMTGVGFGVGAAVVVASLMFLEKGRKLSDDITDKILLVILPMMGLACRSCKSVKVEAEEYTEDENTEDASDVNEDEEFHGRYCVFCSKLNISRKRVMHDPQCTCHNSPPISSCSSTSSYFGFLLYINTESSTP